MAAGPVGVQESGERHHPLLGPCRSPLKPLTKDPWGTLRKTGLGGVRGTVEVGRWEERPTPSCPRSWVPTGEAVRACVLPVTASTPPVTMTP